MPGRHTLRTATKPLAALLLPLALMAGCYGGRTTIPSEPQRITEAEGRKARQQREGVEKAPAQAAAPAAAPQPAPVVLKVETKPAPEAAKVETATTAVTAMEPAQPAAVDAQAVQPAPAKVVVKAVPAKQAEPLKQAEPAQTEAAASADQAFAKVAVTAPKETAPKEAAAKVAAQQAPVTKTVTVTMADAKPTEQAKQAAHPLYVQMGSFTAEKNAEGAVAWLKANGYEASRVVRAEHEGTTLYRVQAGPYQDPAAAHKVLDELKVHWPQAFIPAD